MAPSTLLPPPKRITASNLPLSVSGAAAAHTEPAVEVVTDTLPLEPVLGGALMKASVSTVARVPTSNDGHGSITLDKVPGMGIVLPGGLNLYYLDVAPNTEGVMHRTTSADYLVVLQGALSLMTPPNPFDARVGPGEPVETLCHTGDVVLQRGMMHALSNRTDQWVRLFGVVVDSEKNRVPVPTNPSTKQESFQPLDDAWLQ